jgi:hypothetical protein
VSEFSLLGLFSKISSIVERLRGSVNIRSVDKEIVGNAVIIYIFTDSEEQAKAVGDAVTEIISFASQFTSPSPQQTQGLRGLISRIVRGGSSEQKR